MGFPANREGFASIEFVYSLLDLQEAQTLQPAQTVKLSMSLVFPI